MRSSAAALNSLNPTCNLYGVSGLPHPFILKPSFELCSFIHFKMELLWFTSKRKLWGHSYCHTMAKSCNKLNPYDSKNWLAAAADYVMYWSSGSGWCHHCSWAPKYVFWSMWNLLKSLRLFSRTRSSAGIKWHQRNNANLPQLQLWLPKWCLKQNFLWENTLMPVFESESYYLREISLGCQKSPYAKSDTNEQCWQKEVMYEIWD